MATNHARKLHRHRCELESETGRITTGHHRGPRRCAGGIAGITCGEIHTAKRNRVDVGRRHGAVGNTATGQAQVVVAEVIRDDHDDVRRPFLTRCERCRLGGPGLPGDLAIGRRVFAQKIFERKHRNALTAANGHKTDRSQHCKRDKANRNSFDHRKKCSTENRLVKGRTWQARPDCPARVRSVVAQSHRGDPAAGNGRRP